MYIHKYMEKVLKGYMPKDTHYVYVNNLKCKS